MNASKLAPSGNLAAVLPRLPHHMEMINRTINGGYPVKLGVPLVEALEQDLVRFREALTKWVGDDQQPHLYEALGCLDAPLATLCQYFSAPADSVMTQEDLRVLVGFIYDRIRDLRAIAGSIKTDTTYPTGFEFVAPTTLDAIDGPSSKQA